MNRPNPEHRPAWERPIRMPADLALTHAEPPFAIAGETSTWRLTFVLGRDLPAGLALKLQLAGGRNNKGHFGDGTVSATLADGTPLEVAEEGKAGTLVLSAPSAGLKRGETVTVALTDCQAPGVRQLNKFFVLYFASPSDSGAQTPRWAGGSVWTVESAERILAVCTLHILGGVIDHLRAIVPAQAAPGEAIDILVRPEDARGNLAHAAPGAVSVWLNGVELAASCAPVADSTCITARTVLKEPGTHRLRVVEKSSGREALSNPVVCGDGGKVFWGMIHGHTEMSDGTGTLEQYFHQLRDEVALDFAATADHDHLWETPDGFWKVTQEAVKRWHEPGRFVTLLGYEWAKWRKNGDGDRNVYYLGDDRPMYRSEEGDYPAPPDLFAALAANRERAIVIPHHTGHGGNFCDWKDHDEACERLVEIFQLRGSYECSPADGNPAPEKESPFPPFEAGNARQALALGCRVGFTGGGDDHAGLWGSEATVGGPYKQGLMSVEAEACTREALFAALFERRVVATTGPRILLTYRLDGAPMGSELSMTAAPSLANRRRLTVTVHGTEAIDRVDIVRNGRVAHTVPGTGLADISVFWVDNEPLDGIWMPPARHCPHPFVYYYVRVVQRDGEVAWASPVWVDP